jgi:hypothetical protein
VELPAGVYATAHKATVVLRNIADQPAFQPELKKFPTSTGEEQRIGTLPVLIDDLDGRRPPNTAADDSISFSLTLTQLQLWRDAIIDVRHMLSDKHELPSPPASVPVQFDEADFSNLHTAEITLNEAITRARAEAGRR